MASLSQEPSIAPNGDVIFLVGAEKMEFRVYSLVLKINSTVFNAMLEPHFKEGQNLIEEYPIQIPLPDDDPDSMSIIFNIIHGQNDLVPKTLSAIRVVKIAIASDKYNMNNALKFAINQWLNVDTLDVVSLWHLTMAAYLFNESEPFRHMTQKLILNYSESYLDLMLNHDCVNSEVFAKVSCMLEESRNKLRTEIYSKFLEESLFLNALCCQWCNDDIISSLKFMNTYKLRPKDIGSKNISKMTSEVKMIPEFKADSTIPTYGVLRCVKHCEHPSFQNSINQFIKSVLADQRGLCLTCLQINSQACTH